MWMTFPCDLCVLTNLWIMVTAWATMLMRSDK